MAYTPCLALGINDATDCYKLESSAYLRTGLFDAFSVGMPWDFLPKGLVMMGITRTGVEREIIPMYAIGAVDLMDIGYYAILDDRILCLLCSMMSYLTRA